ncbi:MAG: Uma2 family endonuclease [Cyanobacteria bacterium P01_G01_bin.38]
MTQELDAQTMGKPQPETPDNPDLHADSASDLANASTSEAPIPPTDSPASEPFPASAPLDNGSEADLTPAELEAVIEFGDMDLAEPSPTMADSSLDEVDDSAHEAASVLQKVGEIANEAVDISDEDDAQTDLEPPVADASPPIKRYSCEDYAAKYYTIADTRHELANGCLQSLPSPSFKELLLAQFLKKELDQLIEAAEKPWQCLCEAGLRTGWRQVRLPHVYVIYSHQTEDMVGETTICQTPPALVIEIVTLESGLMPYRHKRSEYAALGVPEYWIVDTVHEQVVVLVLEDGLYSETVYTEDTVIVSPLFPEFNLDSETLLASCALA